MSAVVFDLDGTLIDSAPDLGNAVNLMLSGEGLEPLDLPTVVSFIGNGLPRLVELAMGARGMDMSRHDDLTSQVLDHYNAGNSALTSLYPGVLEMLEGLHRDGHVLGLCTNKPVAPARQILAHFGLLDLFGCVIGGDSMATRKPDPAPLLATFSTLGKSGIYVGDSEVDAQTASQAGVPFALYTKGYRKTPVGELTHNWTFEDFADLPGIIAKGAPL